MNSGLNATEILFAVATLHQLVMFLHFPNEGKPALTLQFWYQEYGIMSELQGKMTELQSLDSQPSFGVMLDKSAKVQFNVNAKRRVAAASVDMKSSSKQKKLAFFSSHTRPPSSPNLSIPIRISPL